MKTTKLVTLLILALSWTSLSFSQELLNKSSNDDIGSILDFDPRIESAPIVEENFEISTEWLESQSGPEQFESGQMCEADDCKRGRKKHKKTELETESDSDSDSEVAQTIELDAKQPVHVKQIAAFMREQFTIYSTHPRILNLIKVAQDQLRTNSYTEKRYNIVTKSFYFVAFCYRAVKQAVQKSGLVNYYLPGDIAELGVAALKRAHFKNLMDLPDYAKILALNPQMVPKGMIIVYKTNPATYTCTKKCTKPSPAGHIEIKTADAGLHGYVSVSQKNIPTYGYLIPQHRQIIGVMYKTSL